jgi:PKD repeat protein
MKPETSIARTSCPPPGAGRLSATCTRSLVLLLLALPGLVPAQFTWTTNNGSLTLAAYTGSGGAVAIPASTNGLPVTSIGRSAFGGCSNLTSVTMGNSVTSIGDFAFNGCSGLTSVTMGNSLTTIGQYAFAFCTALTSVSIPGTVSGIGMYAFGGCSSLTSVTVPDGVASIPDYAFINCLSLADVTLSNGVGSIGDFAFCDCRRLTGMTIPNSVTSIGENAFLSSGLTTVAIPSSVTSIEGNAFQDCFSLTGVYFQGTAPRLGSGGFGSLDNTTVYYLPCSSGWSSTYSGLPDVELNWIAFTASPAFATFAQLPLTVNLTSPAIDNCGHAITKWSWSFGDGSTGTAQNPTHTYTTYGTFTPSLLATNSAGVLVVGAGPPVTVSPPTVAFTANPTGGTVPLTVSFASAGVDNGGHAVTNWNWSFGDGPTSTAQNPSHTYASRGTFSPVVIATNDLGDAVTGSGPVSIVVLWGDSTVGFTASPAYGTVPDTVSFASAGVDNGGRALTNWNWSFGDGSTSSVQNPSHTYTTAGNFAPSLLATNNAGVLVVGVGPSVSVFWPSVAWTINPTLGVAPLMVSFTSAGVDSSGNAVTNWNWSFGDGSTSTAQNPTHTYTTTGLFDPALTATNNVGVTVIAGLGSVEVLPAGTVGFTASPTNGVVPLTVNFTAGGIDGNGYAVTRWNWSFGDGSTSTAQNPSHTYTATGTFSLVLIATNSLGGMVAGSGPPSITVTAVPPTSNLVQNGGFETGDFTDWTLFAVDTADSLVDDGTKSGISPHSGSYLAALGSAGAPSYLSQTLATVAGLSYSLSLWLDSPDGLTPNEFLVSWNGNTLFDELNIPAIGWTSLQFLVSATGPATVLEFGFRDDSSYLALDDISVLPAAAPVGFADVGVRTNQFGFVITGTSNLVVVVEASTKLVNPTWYPLQTNTLTGGSFYFNDPEWTNYPSRFYRLRWP